MRERPILMSAPMVRAILAGTKTQTRRVVKPQPEAEHGGEPYWFVGGYRAWIYRRTTDLLRKGGNVLPCPYGQPGDRLWVREAWAKWGRDDQCGEGPSITHEPIYRADNWPWDERDQWRPSIHMPRWASRITLEIISVRVERLQVISVGDAIAEGIPRGGPENPDGIEIREYRQLWERINGHGSWEANPFVWVVTFRRIDHA